MQHPALEDLLDPIRVLYDDVRKKVIQYFLSWLI
jgi:hypothetical protein